MTLANPLSTDLSVLRTTLLGSLLDIARHNRARGAATVRLFEAGGVYLPTAPGQLPREPYQLGAVLTGAVRPPGWREGHPPAVDFFAAKGVLEGLLDGLRTDWGLEAAHEPFLHPGRAARIIVAGAEAGWIGEVHPLVAAQWDLRDTVAAFELDLDAVPEPPIALYRELTDFPDVREDLAVVVSDGVSRGRADRGRAPRRRPAAGQRRGVRRLPRSRAARRGQRVAGGGAHLPGARPDADRRGGRGAPRRDREGGRRRAGGRIRAS